MKRTDYKDLKWQSEDNPQSVGVAEGGSPKYKAAEAEYKRLLNTRRRIKSWAGGGAKRGPPPRPR